MTAVVPFSASEELYTKLHASPDNNTLYRKTSPKMKDPKDYLPGVPRIPLPISRDEAQVQDLISTYLRTELISSELNRFSPYLWLIATQNSSHISSLTHQLVRGRNVVITEKPDLHLTWIYDRVYLKPIPKVLLSYAFWKCFLVDEVERSPVVSSNKQAVEAAKGYLRSYSHLIHHRSDFNIARENGLIPRSTSYFKLIRFLQTFEKIPDSEVSPRYLFGELRVGRLNFWFKIIFRRLAFQKIHGDYASYFARFYGPFLFAFSILSVMLSAMQVLLQAKSLKSSAAVTVIHGFSVFAMVLVAVVVTAFIAMFLILILRELTFACAGLRRKRKEKSATQC
ncbi:hypothetical protein M3J07_011549 [Ascochyta lentis]